MNLKVLYLRKELIYAANLYKKGLISYFERLFIESKIFTELFKVTGVPFFKEEVKRVTELMPLYSPFNALKLI